MLVDLAKELVSVNQNGLALIKILETTEIQLFSFSPYIWTSSALCCRSVPLNSISHSLL